MGLRTKIRGLLGKQKFRIPTPWNPYLDWLSFANAGMMCRGNVYSMDFAISHLPSESPLVEIGSFAGLSANTITYLKEKYKVKNRLFTCDKWEFESTDGSPMLGDSKTISLVDYQAFVKNQFLQNIRMFSRNDLPHTIEAYSDE